MNNNSLLLEKVRQGDKNAEEEIILNNLNLVHSIAIRFSGRGYEVEDLSQIGVIGLIKAVKRFDASYNVKFSTYAVPVIMGEIKRFLRDDGMIKISRSLKQTAIQGRKCAEALRWRLGREPTTEEIAQECGITAETLLEAFDAILPVDTITPSDDEGKDVELNIPTSENDEEMIINKIFVSDMLNTLSKRERQIIILRYFKAKTQSEVSKIIGVSQVQISRIEKSALMKLKTQFSR